MRRLFLRRLAVEQRTAQALDLVGERRPLRIDLSQLPLEAAPLPTDHAELEIAQEEAPADGACRIAIVGRPNVGKSSLLNALAGETRSLVDDFPGTTRDVVDTTLERDGRTYVLLDTAGMRRPARVKEGVEKLSVGRSIEAVRRSDVTLLLIEPTEGMTDQEARIAQRRKPRPPVTNLLRTNLDRHRLLGVPGSRDRGPMRIDRDAASPVVELRVVAAPVHPEHERLVLDRAGPQQDEPVFLARDRPVGDHGKQGRPPPGRGPEQLGKTQVVADQRSDPKPSPVEERGRAPGGVMRRFVRKTEWALL